MFETNEPMHFHMNESAKIERLKRKKIAEIRTVGANAILDVISSEHPINAVFKNEGYKRIVFGFAWENGDLLKVTLYKAWVSEWMEKLSVLFDALNGGISFADAKNLCGKLGFKADSASLLKFSGSTLEKCDIRAEKIVVPDGTVKIGANAFRGCHSLTKLFLPASVIEICPSSFDGCDSLPEICVDEKNAFYKSSEGILLSKNGGAIVRCPEGKTGIVKISRAISEIFGHAFCFCEKITEIDFDGTISEWKSIEFGRNWSLRWCDLKIVCTDGELLER